MKNLLADLKLGPITGKGPLGLENDPTGSGAANTFNKVLSTTIGVLSIVAFIFFTFQVITGAVGIITSAGDKAALENARTKITHGVIGVIVVIAAVFLIQLIGYLIGVDLLQGASNITNL